MDYDNYYDVVHYTAASGETNHLTITSSDTSFVVVDSGATITVASPCQSVSAHEATCPTRRTPDWFTSVSGIHIDLGDGSDTATSTAACGAYRGGGSTPAPCWTEFTGGTGNDVMAGGAENDLFWAGHGSTSPDGNDSFSGGGGYNIVDYSYSDAPLHLSLDGIANDGQTGELDNLAGDVGVVGGAGNDSLIGNAGANHLEGGPGTDTIEGADGDDVLYPGRGGSENDVVDAGAGNDTVNAEYSQNAIVHGGTGNDTLGGGSVYGDEGDDVINGATTAAWGGPGADTISFCGDAYGGADDDRMAWCGYFHGGDGTDTLDYSIPNGYSNSGVVVSLDGIANDQPAVNADPDGDIERVIGTLYDDVLTGSTRADYLQGRRGNDVLSGGGGNDTLRGGPSDAGASWENPPDADTLSGDDGDDVLIGDEQADALNGGGGTDTADYSASSAAVDLSLDGIANDGASGEGDNIATDVENMRAGSGDDVLTGSAGANILDSGAGDDQLSGGPGADTIGGGAGNDLVDYSDRTNGVVVALDGSATSGNSDDGPAGARDTVMPDVEDIWSGSGNDVLTGNSDDNLLVGGAGDDEMRGLAGDDTVSYADRTEDVWADLEGDADDGAATEADLIGNDVENLLGGAGADVLAGGQGVNKIDGGPGGDQISGGPGADVLIGGDGSDLVSYVDHFAPVTASLAANTGTSAEDGGGDSFQSIEGLEGGAGNDQLTGDAGQNGLWGGPGQDALQGGAASDWLDGEDGSDTLDGGPDDDWLIGGLGDDALSGGPGLDAVSYEERSATVRATIGGSGGVAGETDSISSDVEGISAGSGADVLRGSANENALWGGAGADDLDPGPGSDFVDGGDGEDQVTILDGEEDQAECGPDADRVRADTVDIVAADCEKRAANEEPTTTATQTTTTPDTGTPPGAQSVLGVRTTDRTAPRLRIGILHTRLPTFFKHGLKVRVRSNEAATVELRLTVGKKTVARKQVSLRANQIRVAVLKPTTRLAKQMRSRRALRLSLRIDARDRSGNVGSTARTITIKR